jgi:hypothetical protein
MTILLSIAAFVNSALIMWVVSYALWKKKPHGFIGLIWWLAVTSLVALFSVVSFVAALALAASTSLAAHLALLLVVLLVVWMFLTHRAEIHT